MDASAPSTPYAPWRIAERHRDPPQWHVPKAPCSPRVPVPARRPALATAGRKPQVWDQLSHQSTRVPRDRHHSKPLQFHRRLDQTFQEHESPLRYPGCVATPKYLMRLMFFNSQPSSACIHSCDEPRKSRPKRYELKGKQVVCPHCGHDEFAKGHAKLNTAGMTFLNMDWANRSATYLACAECGRMEWFLQAPRQVD